MKTLAVFNSKTNGGKSSLVYHLAHMYAYLGTRVLVVDLDPQAELTAMFLDEDRLEGLWAEGEHRGTIYGALQPVLDGSGDVLQPHVEHVGERLFLLAGDLALAILEDTLGVAWGQCLVGEQQAFHLISAFWRAIDLAAHEHEAEVVLIDVASNLGALSRASLINAEWLILQLSPDLFALQGLENLGSALHRWKDEWSVRRPRNPVAGLALPPGTIIPAGYVIMQPQLRLDRRSDKDDHRLRRIPAIYRREVFGGDFDSTLLKNYAAAYCLASLKHYVSLASLAQEARKPMFFLRPADGARGAHAEAVVACFGDYRSLVEQIDKKVRTLGSDPMG